MVVLGKLTCHVMVSSLSEMPAWSLKRKDRLWVNPQGLVRKKKINPSLETSEHSCSVSLVACCINFQSSSRQSTLGCNKKSQKSFSVPFTSAT